MARRHTNTQMFALQDAPPDRVQIAGRAYGLVRVFKHDFWAATCLYEREDASRESSGGSPRRSRGAWGEEGASMDGSGAPPGRRPGALGSATDDIPGALGSATDDIPRAVVKFGRARDFCGIPMRWAARAQQRHEESIYGQLAGVRGVPRWMGRLGDTAYALEYIDARPLDHPPAPAPGFFDRLRDLFDAVHARGVALTDANKRSNILIGPGEQPYVVDFQLSLRLREDLPRPLARLVAATVRYIMQRDLYHLYKHKRRMAPDEVTSEEFELSRRRSGLHLLHRKLTKPYRTVRRGFLRKQHETGRLQSPTEQLEDHHQPEKEKWRSGSGE